ncbi:unnamed protein product, partial [Eretmochelys imbricata]
VSHRAGSRGLRSEWPGPRGPPRFQYAYDGRDFISFDDQTGPWVAAEQPAFPQKQSWETGKTWTQYVRWYLKRVSGHPAEPGAAGEWGPAAAGSNLHPKVSVSRRDAPDGSITLSCHTRGSYPHPIHISWMQDGKDILVEEESSGILPNADGTYYMQSSLEISLQEEDRHRYACQVEHSSLAEPALVWTPGKKGSLPLWVLASIALAALILAGAVGASVTLWRGKSAGPWRPSYALAAT